MQQRQLGASGLYVSRLGLGTMTWGQDTDEHEARAQLVAFLDAGGTLIDTAASYTEGRSEEILGELIGAVVSRDQVTVATKAGVGHLRGVEEIDTSRGYLLRSLDRSLQRLRVDHVDLWQVHLWSDRVPIEETLTALDHAVSSGRAAYVGVSNYSGWQSAQAATWQQAVPGRVALVSNQVEYSLVERYAEAEVIPAAQALGLGILPWSPLGRGVLSGKYRSGIPLGSRAASDLLGPFAEHHLTERNARIVEAVSKAAEGLGWSPVEVALAWVRDQPGVVAPIVGARTLTQLEESLHSEGRVLPEEIQRALADVSAPGTGELA